MNLRSLALSLPLLCLCAVAQAQTVPFNTLRAGSLGPPNAPTGGHVVQSPLELARLGFPSVTGVDFQREVVLAVFAGPQRSSGSPASVAVQRIDRAGANLLVTYRVTRPSGAGPTVTRRPFVLVRTARVSGQISFTSVGGALPLPNPSPQPSPGGLIPPGTLPFHIVSQGSTSAGLPSGQHVFRSAQELRESGYERLLPDPSSIRWDLELVAVILAGQPDYRVRATKLRGSLSAPAGGRLTLDYELRTTAPTGARWYQVLRFSRVADVRFQEALPAGAVKGQVFVTRALGLNFVSLRTQQGQRLLLHPRSEAEKLVPLAGESVILELEKTSTIARKIKRLVYPEPFSGSGRLVGVPGKVRLAQVGHSLNLAGPLTSFLERGIGRDVTQLRGFRFSDRRLVVTEFMVFAKRPAAVTSGGVAVAQLATGQPARVIGVGSAGLFVVPSRQGAPGYVAPDALSLSPTAPPLTTLGTGPATATTAPGITGTIRSTGPR